MASLISISQPPEVLTSSEGQQSSDSSNGQIQPVLRLHLTSTTIYVTPASANLPTCFHQVIGSSVGHQNGLQALDEDPEDESTHAVKAGGELWLTEREFSFFSASDKSGFQLSYPSIALHAISRSPPSFLAASRDGVGASTSSTASASEASGSLYCQLDLSSPDVDEDDDSNFLEMHILTQNQTELDQLFEALSQCAALHPSALGGDGADDTGGHPFSAFAPFGSGLQDGTNGASLDMEEDSEDLTSDVQATSSEDQELSETGRRNLAHLESVMQWPESSGTDQYDDAEEEAAHPFTGSTLPNAWLSEAEPTNTLILSNLPVEFFIPSICSIFLSLLNTYGPMMRWTPLPAVGRAVVVFESTEGASFAKAGLDRLILPYESEDVGDSDMHPDSSDTRIQRASTNTAPQNSFLRATFGPTLTGTSSEVETLGVPITDKNFLISPPGSPPVGWEPIREDPPNRDTLAEDLMKALADLRDTGSHIESHLPQEWGSSEAKSDTDSRSLQGNGDQERPKGVGMLGAPQVIIAPSRAPALRSAQPSWLNPNGVSQEADTEAEISVPGVSVQSFDPEEEETAQGVTTGTGKLFQGVSISSVKATVESMRGPLQAPSSTLSLGANPAGSNERKITPTSRPPLSDLAFKGE